MLDSLSRNSPRGHAAIFRDPKRRRLKKEAANYFYTHAMLAPLRRWYPSCPAWTSRLTPRDDLDILIRYTIELINEHKFNALRQRQHQRALLAAPVSRSVRRDKRLTFNLARLRLFLSSKAT